MHEIGIVRSMCKTVLDYARENNIQQISEIVCQIGELSLVVPEYVEEIAQAVRPEDFQIEHYGSTWLVTGAWLERLVQNINFEDYESRNYFDQQLRKVGLFRRLEEMGIQDGDTVDIYDFEFEYQR